MQDTIGIDIAKATLDVHRLADGARARFANDAEGLRALGRWIAAAPALVVFEATGAYHRGLEAALAAAGRPFIKVNPARARRFAEATGKLAKTDRVDAAMLARMGAVLDLEPKPAPAPARQALRDLVAARRGLVRDLAAAKAQGEGIALKLLARLRARRIRLLEAQIRAVDAAITDTIAADPELAAQNAILCGIPGFGPVSAAALLAEMPELGRLEPKAAANLAGLAPIDRASGQSARRARIRGGRWGARRALFMPALAAARHNPDLAARYRALRAAGKPPKLALVAVMRKLMLLANALLRDNRPWTPTRP